MDQRPADDRCTRSEIGVLQVLSKTERRRSRTDQRMGYMRLPILKGGRVWLTETVCAGSAPPEAPCTDRLACCFGGGDAWKGVTAHLSDLCTATRTSRTRMCLTLDRCYSRGSAGSAVGLRVSDHDDPEPGAAPVRRQQRLSRHLHRGQDAPGRPSRSPDDKALVVPAAASRDGCMVSGASATVGAGSNPVQPVVDERVEEAWPFDASQPVPR